jgi:hypothetical protein
MLFVYDYKNLDMGTIEDVHENTLTITKETWAPGIWAGMETHKVLIGQDDAPYTIQYINLELRELFFNKPVTAKSGDILRLSLDYKEEK